MKGKKNLLILFSCVFMIIIAGLFACTRSAKEIIPSSEYAPYVNAYTGGVISQSSPIRIELTQDQPMVDLNNELKDNPFRFTPSIKGKAYWVSNNTVEFLPEEGQLKPGELYQGTFQLGNFVEVDSKLKSFDFSFRVQESNFTLHTAPLEITASSPDKVTVKGEIRFSDKTTKEQVEKMLSASGGLSSPTVTVESTSNPSAYSFVIGNIQRNKQDYELEITADGKSAGIDRKQSETITIPAKDSFRFLSAERIDQPENGIQIVFSDPVSDAQDLKGLIEIPEISSYIFQVTDNRVNVYFEASQLSKLTLKIHEGIKNSQGKALGNSHSISFGELSLKPQVEIASAGAIIPDSKNLVIPFRAVNLYAVDLRVIRIFENNVLMFMQNNSLSSANELRRSGRLVYKKTLFLGKDSSKDLHKWENYSIDLAGLIHQEPGAIYRVILSFKQEYSAYPCGGESPRMQFSEETESLTKVTSGTLPEEDEAVWDKPETYYYFSGNENADWSQYRWDERDNPCHPSYYMTSDRIATCNVLASNIGMIVKRNSMNKLWIAVNNILDTKPVEKAQVTVYNFQLQPVGKAVTDSEGFATIETKGVPFIVVAESDKQKAYVKVADGEEQSTSRFDVGGKDIQKGLKGFVYGERGVWRPGDTLHISFILEDRTKRIPDKHPVALELYNPRGQFYSKLISTNGLNGFYTFKIPTQAEDPTGLWNAYIKVGGTAFHKALRVETIKPNRLKINLKLPGEILKASDKEVQAHLSSAWLTGATASRLKAKVEMSLSKVNTQFKNYGTYIFNNPATEFTSVRTDVFSGTLDESGNAGFMLKLPASENAPGMLQANITTQVFEPGGDASIQTQSVPYSPFPSYVGINLNQPQGRYIETDKDHVFDVITVSPDGKPVNRSGL